MYWAHKNEIPIIVPGIVDGAVGSQIWFFSQQHKDFKIDILMDETKLSDIIYDSKKSGAFMVAAVSQNITRFGGTSLEVVWIMQYILQLRQNGMEV